MYIDYLIENGLNHETSEQYEKLGKYGPHVNESIRNSYKGVYAMIINPMYTVERVLGEGSFGIAYLVKENTT